MEDNVAKQPPKKKGILHYGYVVVVAGFLTQSLLLAAQRSLSLSINDIVPTLGVTLGEAGQISAWFGLIYAGAGFFWGWLSDTIGPRYALSLAGACVAVGLVLFGILGPNGLAWALFTYSIVGLGAAGIFIATVPKLIAAWFVPDKRGHAMRFVTPGGGLTSMLLGIILPLGINAVGWATCYIVIGCFGAVVTLFFFLLLRDSPYERGLTPVGSPPDAVPTPPVVSKTVYNFVEVLKMPITWHFGIMYTIYQFAWSANSTYYVATIRSAGYTGVEAGLAVTYASLFSIVMMQVWGPLSDRLERKTVILMGCCMYGISALIYFYLLISGKPALWVCYVMVCLMQGAFGINSTLMAAMGDYFPAKLRGTGNGVVSTMTMAGRYGGPAAAGIFLDNYGGKAGYGIAFASVFAFLAGIVAMTLPKKKVGGSKGEA